MTQRDELSQSVFLMYSFRWFLHSEHRLREQTAETRNVDRTGKVDTRVSLWHLMHIHSLPVDRRCHAKTIKMFDLCLLMSQQHKQHILHKTMQFKKLKGIVHLQLEQASKMTSSPHNHFWVSQRKMPSLVRLQQLAEVMHYDTDIILLTWKCKRWHMKLLSLWIAEW